MARSSGAKTSPILAPGMIAWATTWPDWERIPGQESPHPLLALSRNAAGEVAVLPLSSKPDLGQAQLPITVADCPSAFAPRGPLSVSPSFICIADRRWEVTLRWATVAPGALVLPKGRIGLRRIAVLDPADWQRLQQTLGVAIRRALEHKP
jgi:hypothetical protein